MALVEISGMERHYVMTSETVRALDGIDLSINKGERIILLGPSGSGKTTLLNCVAALDNPTEGDYGFNGTQVPRVTKKITRKRIELPGLLYPLELVLNLGQQIVFFPVDLIRNRKYGKEVEAMTKFRRENIGYVFQFFNLLQDLTVLENILLIQELSDGRDEARARELLALVGLEDEIDRFPAEISGGQQQRVAIARSLAKSPKLLLGDELTGNLDSNTSSKVMEVLVKACETENITVIMVTHDESLAKYATRVVRLDSGKIVSDEKVNN
uniref:ABC transporter ATP-binding protein (ABC.CD.A) n=1 Tax=uncultured marine group II/III euryarchaeote KM3_151_F02 TaxID=1457893 RepID=A0A075GE67_9EURY|nr:ABC transporter ATP-binding protein (ABC.CD.A) [uncultured marine group II/III euryarchaeote KM3_151_F02]